MILTYNDSMPKDNFSDEAENLYLRKILSTNIRNLRAKYHLTQERLAENAEISLPYLSDIERGAKFPSLSLFINLVDALGVSADYVLSGEIEAGKHSLSNDIANKLEELTPKQRIAVWQLLDTYIKNLD